jgi:hypothetical protein
MSRSQPADKVSRREPAGKEEAAARSRRRRRLLLAALFLLAFVVRLYAAAGYAVEPTADAADYHRLAVGLAAGRGYVSEDGLPTAWRPPGYPAFLACVYAAAGPSVGAAAAAQAALGALTALLLAAFGGAVAGRREGLLAGLLAAVYPGFFWLPRLLLSENLALFLLPAALWAAAALAVEWRPWRALLLGLLLGVGTLVRGPNILFTAVLLLWLAAHFWRRGREWRRGLAALALASAGFAAVLLPWAARNYLVFHKPVLVATQDGMGLYASFWPPRKNGRPVWGALPGAEDPAVAEAGRAGDEVAVSGRLRQVALERLREHPGHFFRVIPSKLVSLAAPFDWETFPRAAGETRSLNPAYVLVLIPAMLGLLVLRRRAAPLRSLLWVAPASVLVQALITYGSPRFRLPAETSALVWAAAALVWAWDKKGSALLGALRRRKTTRGV